MKKVNIRFYLAFLMGFSLTVMGAARPNVIVIMADDLGAEGLGCYGSSIYTSPNIDRMASEGIDVTSLFRSTDVLVWDQGKDQAMKGNRREMQNSSVGGSPTRKGVLWKSSTFEI